MSSYHAASLKKGKLSTDPVSVEATTEKLHAASLKKGKLSTDPVSVEATTEKLHAASLKKGKLSTDPVSVEATTEKLWNESIAWFTRRIRLNVAVPTGEGSLESFFQNRIRR